MNEFENQQIALMHRMVTIVYRVVMVAMFFGFLITAGLAVEAIRTELAVRDIKVEQSQLNELRASRASDIANQSARNCDYTKKFVGVFHDWAQGLDIAERAAASSPNLTPSERNWHVVRVGTYATLFKSLDTLGTNACPKQGTTP